MKQIRIGHGGGGELTGELIREIFLKEFSNPVLARLQDSALLEVTGNRLAFTTDSYVVDPPFFPGGDIGRIAVCGTVNDLAVMGAEPIALSSAFILEEGFPISDLKRVVHSMREAADEAGVSLVTGDTKVVGRGKGDKVYITTSGIGRVWASSGSAAEDPRDGDAVLINGPVGDHGLAVLAARGTFRIETGIESDAAPLFGLIASLYDAGIRPRLMRDLTRGGLTGVLCELCAGREWGFLVDEEEIPVRDQVRGLCELLGYDPLGVANEGKLVAIVGREEAQAALEIMRRHPYGRDGAVIGQIVGRNPGRACLKTVAGGTRILRPGLGEELPRIC